MTSPDFQLAALPNPETRSKDKIHLPKEEVMAGLVSSRHGRAYIRQIGIPADEFGLNKEYFKESHIEAEYAIQAKACKMKFIISFIIDQGDI